MVISALSTAVSGIIAQSTATRNIASNIASARVTGSVDGDDTVVTPKTAYTPLDTTFLSSASGQGRVAGVQAETQFRDPATVRAYDPESPFANSDGVIETPNVSYDQELTNMIAAETAYKANIAVAKTAIDMGETLLDVLDNNDA